MNRIASLIMMIGMALFLITDCGTKKTKEQLYAEALNFEKQENFKEAIATYEQLINSYPRANFADSILFKVGQIYSNSLSDFEHAIEAHKNLIKKYPDSKFSAQSLFMIGFHYANSPNDTTEAKHYYNKFLEQYPEHELASSVRWELNFLGKDINDIDFLKSATEEASKDEGTSKPKNIN